MAEHGASPGSRRLPTLSLGAGPAQPFRRSLTDLADEKVSFLDAAILILSPLAGLRPSRSGITLTLNLPNPGSDTSAPLAAASTMSFKMSSTMDLACALLTSCASAIFAMSSVVFICRRSQRFSFGGRPWHGPSAMSLLRHCLYDAVPPAA